MAGSKTEQTASAYFKCSRVM